MSRARGFVLPTTLMVMTLLTVLLAAAFTMVSAEFRASDNSVASQRALAIAEAGMQEYLAGNGNFTGIYDSVGPIAFPRGYAAVAASRLVPSVGAKNAVWVVRSYGYATDPSLTGQTLAMRVVGRLTTLNPGKLYAKAAWMSAGPVNIFQGIIPYSNPINGNDLCTATPSDTFGMLIKSGDYNTSGGPPVPGTGNPVGGAHPLSTRAAVADSTHIDWAEILAGNFTYDHDVTAGGWPALGGFPIYWVDGNMTLTSAISGPASPRTGILVVRGNLRFGNNSAWRGAVIVGGSITNDNVLGFGFPFYMQGVLISGLNEMITPGSVGTSTIYRFNIAGSQGIRFGSCHVSDAAGSLASLSPIRNGWVDTWALY